MKCDRCETEFDSFSYLTSRCPDCDNEFVITELSMLAKQHIGFARIIDYPALIIGLDIVIDSDKKPVKIGKIDFQTRNHVRLAVLSSVDQQNHFLVNAVVIGHSAAKEKFTGEIVELMIFHKNRKNLALMAKDPLDAVTLLAENEFRISCFDITAEYRIEILHYLTETTNDYSEILHEQIKCISEAGRQVFGASPKCYIEAKFNTAIFLFATLIGAALTWYNLKIGIIYYGTFLAFVTLALHQRIRWIFEVLLRAKK